MAHPFFLSFMAIFVALDVLGNLPFFLKLTQRFSPENRNRMIDRSMAVALAVALAFGLVGEKIFGIFGVTFYDFQIAGGVVLLLISLADLSGNSEGQQASGSTGIVPLAVPLITGPAIIATLIIQVHAHGHFISLSALLANYLIAWIVLRKSEKITDWIGKDGGVILSKLAALFLAAISISMIRSGIFEAIHTFRLSQP